MGWEIKVIQVNLNSLGWGLITKRLMEIELRRAITLAEPFFLSGSGVVIVRDEPRRWGAERLTTRPANTKDLCQESHGDVLFA